jgi:hypothetical protein
LNLRARSFGSAYGDVAPFLLPTFVLPAYLDHLHPTHDGSFISHVTLDGVADARLSFNAAEQITSLECGPRSSDRFLRE